VDELDGRGQRIPVAREDVRAAHCRQAARQLLKRHAVLAPPVPVDVIAAALGLEVSYVRLPRGLDARLVKTEKDARIDVATGQARVRQRFSVAHELGHHCLGHAHDDGTVAEKQANIFAGALLVPQPWLATDVKSGLSPTELASRYDVSSEVLFIALKDGRLLTKVTR